jgi:4'-phosphopantetheinyl transferase
VTKKNRVLLWSARPGALCPAQWRRLGSLLDDTECRQARRFRLEADRRAYVLAHGLRRLALAAWLKVPAASLCFGVAAGGRPQLLAPAHHPVFFSHTHTREAVLVALSADAAVGVDVESTQGPLISAGLLTDFIAQPEVADPDFYFYWTALEAFWKAAGTGLTQGQPRLHFERRAAGHWLARPASQRPGATPAGRPTLIFSVTAPPGCCASLALRVPARPHTLPPAGSAGWLIEERDVASDGDCIGWPEVS